MYQKAIFGWSRTCTLVWPVRLHVHSGFTFFFLKAKNTWVHVGYVVTKICLEQGHTNSSTSNIIKFPGHMDGWEIQS